MGDRNFDDIAEKFSRNIYGTTKGQLRQAILWQDLDNLLAKCPGETLSVLDAGGGEGQTACYLAAKGHHVTLCDLSAEMVSRATARSQAEGVSHNMNFIQCSAQEIGQHLASPVDLIVFHAVLEWVSQPEVVLQALWHCLAPGGMLSLMFYNAHGLLLHNMVAGNFGYVQKGMPRRKKRTLSPEHPQQPEQVYRWLTEIGWQITGKTGVRVFHDYLREKRQQHEDFETLLALEQCYCRKEPWITLARYIHVTAQKPGTKDVL